MGAILIRVLRRYMRSKTRVICVTVAVCFMVITFELLGRELQKFEEKQRELWANQNQAERTFVHNERNEQKMVNSEQMRSKVKKLVKKYSFHFNYTLDVSPWVMAADWVKSREIHPSDTPELGAILKAMATKKIIRADVGHKGTQLKLTLTLKGGQIVAFKPMWYKREDVLSGSPYFGKDRHNGEIAAFHLNRILEFRRAPLVVGRRIDLRREIMPVATDRLLDTFFTEDGNTCFYGKCYYCRGKEDGICGNNTVLEGAVVLWLPMTWKLQNNKHPWSRTYHRNKKSVWETDDSYCETVRAMEQVTEGPRLLDILDTAVFDYLIANSDRHHYEVFRNQPDSILILLDNAKSFGNPHVDDRTILAPIYQCCSLRRSTWERLLEYENGDLGAVLRGVMENEVVSPVLADPHYKAINRRLGQILREIRTCLKVHGEYNVFLED